MEFSEKLRGNPGTLPDSVRNAFTVTADGSDLDISRVELWSNRFGLWVFLAASDTIRQGQTVTAGYDRTAAGSHALADYAGNKVESFTGASVTNSSTRPRGIPGGNVSIKPKSNRQGRSPGGEAVTEGSPAVFLLTRGGDAADSLTVGVSVTESGSMLKGKPPSTVTFAAGSGEAELSVATEDDKVAEPASVITATISSGTGYTVSGDTASASVTVEDDDGAPLTASFADVPESHDGSSPFELRIVFSEAIASSNADKPAQDVKAAIAAGGGDVKRVYREDNTQWTDFLVRVEPTQDGPVTVSVRVPGTNEACSALGAICTPDGRKLSEAVSDTVAGPGAANSAPTGEPTISGTARVGETLTASVSGISDADGLTGATFEYQWIRGSADIEGASDSTYTLATADEGETIRVRVTFTDDGGTEESLTSAATGAVAPAAEPLTAWFADVPEQHDGSTPFELRIVFSDELVSATGGPGTGGAARITRSLAVTGGSVEDVSKASPPARDDFRIRVTPSGDDAVTLSLERETGCAHADAVCTPDERPLSNSPSATVAGPPASAPALRVSDASAAEGEAVEFTVSLSETSSQEVTVAYATSGGTATSGTDFTASSGTLTFEAGESSQTVSVSTVDDSLDEDDETFTLTLSSPANATLADATATGTITDDDDAAPEPLTAEFADVPAAHDGSNPFELRIVFSEELAAATGGSGTGALARVRRSLAVAGGSLDNVSKASPPARADFRIRVTPSGDTAVTLSLPRETGCAHADALCTPDGRPLSNSPSATVAYAASSSDAANGDYGGGRRTGSPGRRDAGRGGRGAARRGRPERGAARRPGPPW